MYMPGFDTSGLLQVFSSLSNYLDPRKHDFAKYDAYCDQINGQLRKENAMSLLTLLFSSRTIDMIVHDLEQYNANNPDAFFPGCDPQVIKEVWDWLWGSEFPSWYMLCIKHTPEHNQTHKLIAYNTSYPFNPEPIAAPKGHKRVFFQSIHDELQDYPNDIPFTPINHTPVFHFMWHIMTKTIYTEGENEYTDMSWSEYLENPDRYEITGHLRSCCISWRYAGSYLRGETDRSRWSRVFNYSWDILEGTGYRTLQVEGETNALFYGVELEVSTDWSVSDLVEAPSELFVVVKEDSSVTGSCSYPVELVTVPATLKAQKKHWAEIFKELGYDNFDTSLNTTNGMHVHLGRDHFLNDRHLSNLVWFLQNPSNDSFISLISERHTEPGLTETYCRSFVSHKWDQRYTNKHLYRDCLDLNTRALKRHSRINTYGRKGTVEFRLFKGIVSYATIIKNLEFVEAVYYFSINRNYLNNTVLEFIKYLESTPKNRFSTLKKFLSRVDLNKIFEEQKVLVKARKIKDPKDWVKEIASRSSDQQKTFMIDLLNNLYAGKVQFTYNIVTGTISYEYLDRGLLSDLDNSTLKQMVTHVRPSKKGTMTCA